MRYKQVGKVVIVDTIREKFAIPSKYYPLHKENTIKTFETNTTELIDKDLDKIIEAINAVPAELGRCYTNIENFVKECKKRHIKIDTYTGWLFLYRAKPIHHAWAVYKNKHIIDFSINPEQISLINNLKGTKDEVRNALHEYDESVKHLPLSEKILNGKVPSNILYVGSKCPPAMGKLLFAKLLDEYGETLYLASGTNRLGQSPYQQEVMQKQGDLRI